MIPVNKKYSFASTWSIVAPLLAAIVIYLALALCLASTKAAWYDEGAYANPAYDLAFRGQMGSNVIEPSGFFIKTYLRGIHERTYYVTPNHLVALAGWFKLFGFSLFSARTYSILWGVVSMAAIFYILCRLFPSPRVAQLAVLLISIDFIFLWTAADVRMEAPANALALCAVASYLRFREDRFWLAVLTSQFLIAAAVFTHPNALEVGLIVPVLAWRDRHRITLMHLLMGVVPYLFFGALWGIYILQSPADFKAQFFANAAGPRGSRLKGILQPWHSIQNEFFRHLRAYARSDLWSAEMNHWMVLVLVIYLAAMVWLFWNCKKGGMQIFITCVATILFALTFLNGLKFSMYLHYAVPFYDAALAAWLLALWQRRGDCGGVAVVVGFAFVFLQVTTSVMHISADEYDRDYSQAIRALEQERAEGKTIMGTAALGFGLGFQGFVDDWRLGFYSGLQPDVLVIDRSYRQFPRDLAEDEPVVVTHVAKILTSTYRPVHRYGSFWLYERVTPNSQVASPLTDTGIEMPDHGRQ